jgi:predicted XRE-type DNA-binding protein
MTHQFKIEVSREGRWWMVYIPEIDGVTQARRLSEAETRAREYIALDQNLPYDDIAIETASVRMQDPVFRELLDSARDIRSMRAHAQKLENEAMRNAQEFAHWLTTYGVPVRDIAELLDISPQRVSQLANEQADERGPGLEPDDVSDLLAKLEASVARHRGVAANSGTASAPLRIKTKTGTKTVRVPMKNASTKALAAKGGSGVRGSKGAKSAAGRKRSHG